MPRCFVLNARTKALIPVDEAVDADGSIIGTDYSQCALVMLSGADYQQMAGGLYLSAADGAVASGLIVGCWVTAYAARSVIAVFRGSSKDE